jgi:hypothetical protein
MRRIASSSAALCLAAGVASATPTVSFSHGAGNTNGGEFIAQTSDRGTFNTFCIERTEYVSMGTTYYYTESNMAIGGGNFDSDGNGGNGGDLISQATKNIYLWYRQGQIDAKLGNLGLTTTQIADAVQESIWLEEESYTVVWSPHAATLQGLAIAAGPVNGSQNVRAMNVWANSDGTGNQQDMLTMIPLPSGAALASVGLLGITAVRRRRA